MTIHLRDVNDNSPVLNSLKDVTLTEGNSKRTIATVRDGSQGPCRGLTISKFRMRINIITLSNYCDMIQLNAVLVV